MPPSPAPVPGVGPRPRARAYGAPGLAARRPDVTFDEVLGHETPEAWGGAVAAIVVAGAPRVGEVALLHRPSRTLILIDLLFNIHEVANLRTRLLLRAVAALGRPGQSLAWRFFVRDRAAAAASARALLDLEFVRIVVAHGEVIEEGARELLAEALAWMLSSR